MHIEIDQSIKVEDPGTSIWAYASKDSTYTISMSSKVKRQIFDEVRLSTKSKNRKAARLKLFAIGVYLLIEDDLSRIQSIMIDREYEGQPSENMIKDYVLRFIRRQRPSFNKRNVYFGHVVPGQGSDRAAYLVHKKKNQPDKVVGLNDIRRVLIEK